MHEGAFNILNRANFGEPNAIVFSGNPSYFPSRILGQGSDLVSFGRIIAAPAIAHWPMEAENLG